MALALNLGNFEHCINTMRVAKASPEMNSANVIVKYDKEMDVRIAKLSSRLPLAAQQLYCLSCLAFLESRAQKSHVYASNGPHSRLWKEVIQGVLMVEQVVFSVFPAENSKQDKALVPEQLIDLSCAFYAYARELTARMNALLEKQGSTKKPFNPPLVRYESNSENLVISPPALFANLGLEFGVITLPAGAISNPAPWVFTGSRIFAQEFLEEAVPELSKKIIDIVDLVYGTVLATYWKNSLKCAVEDVFSILCDGPAAALGLFSFLLGNNKRHLTFAAKFHPHYRYDSGDPTSPDVLLADVFRVAVVALTVKYLNFEGAGAWSEAMLKNAEGRFESLILYPHYGEEASKENQTNYQISWKRIIESTQTVVSTIYSTKLSCQGGKSLSELISWKQENQNTPQRISQLFKEQGPLNSLNQYAPFTAIDVVNCAMMRTLEVTTREEIAQISRQSILILKELFKQDSFWRCKAVRRYTPHSEPFMPSSQEGKRMAIEPTSPGILSQSTPPILHSGAVTASQSK